MLALLLASALAAGPDGVRPVGTDGQPLNLNFETGTLKDWTATGSAFDGQPIKGDTVSPRRGDSKSNHEGQYWIGGFEKHGDKPTGTLTSAPFKVTHAWGSFLVAGGATAETCVELVLLPRNEVIFRASGTEEENLRRVAVDLSKHVGKEVQIRLVDRHTGHWGHLNFDDFRFHAEKPAVAVKAAPLKSDEYKFAGLSPKEAAKAMTVPPGFNVSLFAGEPDVHQPIGFCLDDRGRLWVAEAYVYPRRLPFAGPILPEAERKNGDRIRVFEDTDGDGVHDKVTTVVEGLNLVSGIEIGFGGLWIGAAPYLMFIPIDANDKAGEPKVLLDGWGYQDTHETLNSFLWGPDGWLYGCHGVFTHSKVGKPGTADKDRTPINAGIWRYHPIRHTFEVFAHGTSNPWGLDYNANGDFFAEACVIPHLWHIVQGGRYQRQAGQHFNPYTYTEIGTIAKHRHFVGNQWNDGDRSKSNDVGGGHAHSGLMCYQGGLWPKEYAGKLFMGNIHGHRMNVDEVTPKGSGYEGDRNPDFLHTNDKYALIIAIKAGPDGNAYFCDWYDKQACHRNEPEIWDRTNGRIYKVSYHGAKIVVDLNLQKASDEELIAYQLHANDWYARHARRILQERAAGFTAARHQELRAMIAKQLDANANENIVLRGVWTNHVMGFPQTRDATSSKYPIVNAWRTRCLAERGEVEKSPLVALEAAPRPNLPMSQVEALAYASAMQKIEPSQRLVLWQTVFNTVDVEGDPNLGAMGWFALEPILAVEPGRVLRAVSQGKASTFLAMASRRVGAIGSPEAASLLVEQLGVAANEPHALAYLRGLQEWLKSTPSRERPAGWATGYERVRKSRNAEVRNTALAIAVAFKDPGAIQAMLRIAIDAKADLATRQTAVTAVLEADHNRAGGLLKALLVEPTMRATAIRGMARWFDEGNAVAIVNVYASLSAAEKRDAVNTLASRIKYAPALFDAIAAKTIPAADLPAETVRLLRNLGDASINARIADLWGTVRETPAARKLLIASWAKKLAAPAAPPDLMHGRAVFAKVCMQCHILYGVGGKVGPEITGSNRADLGYLLENILDPSAIIPKEYAATKFELADGRVVVGILKEETKTALTVVTATETLALPVRDVEKRTPSAESMMPDDLMKPLPERDVRNLIAYLRHPHQVPMLATNANAAEFFNGKDLSLWTGDKTLWSVENGEIVGKTATGLKKNQFLVSTMAAADFKLTLSMKLTPNAENSGVQFRSELLPDGEMRGPQADAGAGWWGKLYDEHGLGLVWDKPGDKHIKPGEWNDYVIEATGSRVRTWINGKLCVDLDDVRLSRRGIFAFQLHSGGAMEVRFKDIELKVK